MKLVKFLLFISVFALISIRGNVLSNCILDIEIKSIDFAFTAPDKNIAADWGSEYPHFSEWDPSDRYMPDVFDVIITISNNGEKTAYNVIIEVNLKYTTVAFDKDAETKDFCQIKDKDKKEKKQWKESKLIRKIKPKEKITIKKSFDFEMFSNSLIKDNLWPNRLEFTAKAKILPGECNNKNNSITKALVAYCSD